MKSKMFVWSLVIILAISMSLIGVSFTGCKKAEEVALAAEEEEEAAPAEEEEAAPAEEEEAEEEVAEEAPKLGTESSTYWIEKAGIIPSGEITLYSYSAEGTVNWKIAQKFMEAYPNVIVNWVTIPGGEFATKIMLECETGTEAFDLFWCDSGWTIMFADYLEDITDRIPEELKNDIAPGVISANSFQGKWHGITLFTSEIGLTYNKDILAQAGYDEAPGTWDEFFEVAEACTIDEDNDGIPEIFGVTGITGLYGYLSMFGLMLKNVGGEFWNFDYDNPQPTFNNGFGIRALQIMEQFYTSNFSDPVMATGDDVATRRTAASGLVAMQINSIGLVSGLVNSDFPENKGKFDWALNPVDPGYDSYGLDGSMGFVIRKGGNVDTALAFDLFAVSPEIQKFFTEENGLPPSRMSIVNDEEFVARFPYVPAALEVGKKTISIWEIPNITPITNGFKPIFDNFLVGAIDEEEALVQMEEVFIEAQQE